jgi:hypothetical protein
LEAVGFEGECDLLFGHSRIVVPLYGPSHLAVFNQTAANGCPNGRLSVNVIERDQSSASGSKVLGFALARCFRDLEAFGS